MKATPVKVAGKMYPIKYGFAALRAFSDVTGTTLQRMDQLASNMTLTQAIALVWAGMKDGARVTGEDFSLELDDVADLLDADSEGLSRVLDVFVQSMEAPANNKGTAKKKK
jgi:ABC-type transporter Mla subunit MlaD